MNRSEELAKLLGIKPKITCKLQCIGSKGVDKEGKTMCINHCSKSGLLYPDFTKPNNFVKLCFFKFPNFNNEYYNILEFVSDNFVEIENVNEYIESLYEQLKLEDKRIIKDLSKQAQATQWTY